MNDELIQYYINLLILQYRDRPKARATIETIIHALMIFDIMRAVENGYDVDTAIGVQLDLLAKYVGAARNVTATQFDRTFFGSIDYNQSLPVTGVSGSISYTLTELPDAQILGYETTNQSTQALTDQELRSFIRIKIGQNSSNHSPSSIDLIIREFFSGDAIFTDEMNMTISYIFSESVRRFAEILVGQGTLPKPMAVGIIVTFVPDINNIFGFRRYGSSTVANFLEGMIRYGETPFGSWLKY